MALLKRQTRKRMNRAFRPGTLANHKSQIKAYITFCLYFGLKDIDPDINTICMYVEFLTRSIQSPQTIKNYVSGVRYSHKCLHISSKSLDSHELNLMLRSISITMEHIPKKHVLVTPDYLRQIIWCCDTLGPLGSVLKCAFLFAFFGFLRVSNLAPQQKVRFNPK